MHKRHDAKDHVFPEENVVSLKLEVEVEQCARMGALLQQHFVKSVKVCLNLLAANLQPERNVSKRSERIL